MDNEFSPRGYVPCTFEALHGVGFIDWGNMKLKKVGEEKKHPR